MSVKNRVFAAAFAATLLAGTASFAAAEPRQSRRAAVEEGQTFLEQVFDRVREILTGRKPNRPAPPAPGSWQKDFCGADPNGSPTLCNK
jgi:hypothetical protein